MTLNYPDDGASSGANGNIDALYSYTIPLILFHWYPKILLFFKLCALCHI
jgi:hypothetical protein